jgi:hypothetical protein
MYGDPVRVPGRARPASIPSAARSPYETYCTKACADLEAVLVAPELCDRTTNTEGHAVFEYRADAVRRGRSLQTATELGHVEWVHTPEEEKPYSVRLVVPFRLENHSGSWIPLVLLVLLALVLFWAALH